MEETRREKSLLKTEEESHSQKRSRTPLRERKGLMMSTPKRKEKLVKKSQKLKVQKKVVRTRPPVNSIHLSIKCYTSR